MVEFSQVSDTTDAAFMAAMDLYVRAFPANERHPLDVIGGRVDRGAEQLFVGRSGDAIVFMALLYPLKGTDFILLDYAATTEAHRSLGIGSRFMEWLRDTLLNDRTHLILEVENPRDGDNGEARERRVAFYKRAGVRELKDVRFVLPALDGTTPTEMILMTYPGYAGGSIDRQTVQNLIRRIYRELYNRGDDDILLNTFIDEVPERIKLV